MIPQIMVVSESGVKIGTTFPKRAKQLISKQKAKWVDESHTTIHLIPTEPKEEKDLESRKSAYQSNDNQINLFSEENLLNLAAKRVLEKRNLKRHMLIYVVGSILLYISYAGFFDSYFEIEVFVSILGIWNIIFVAHIFSYLAPNVRANIIAFFTRTTQDKVELEYQKLKKLSSEKITKEYARIRVSTRENKH